jgi:YD repeat-containing protein
MNWYAQSSTSYLRYKRWFDDPESALLTDWVWYGGAMGDGPELPCAMHLKPWVPSISPNSWSYLSGRDNVASVTYMRTDCQTGLVDGPFNYGSGIVRYWKCPTGTWQSPKADTSQEICYRSADVIDPELNRGAPPCADSCFGDPVNAATGNKFERRAEYISPSSPLEFSWTYNSDGSSVAASAVGDILGVARSTNFSRRLTFSVSGAVSTVYVSRPSGGSIRFEPSGSGWISLDTPGVRLAQDADGGWSFRDADNSVDHFGANGVLLSMIDPSGRAIVVAYGADSRLESAIDDQGRQVRFEYSAGNRLQRVWLPDGTSLGIAFDAKGRLASVTHQDGTQRQYRYDEPTYSAATDKADLLTTELDEQGKLLSETFYDSAGRAYQTRQGGVTTESAAFTVTGSQLYSAKTTVTRASGALSETQFGIQSGRVVPLRVFVTCAGCAPRNVQYTYGTFGLPTQIIRNGIVETRTYDALGRVASVTQAQGRVEQRTTHTEWHPIFNLPVARYVSNAAGETVSSVHWSYDDAGLLLQMTEDAEVQSAPADIGGASQLARVN